MIRVNEAGIWKADSLTRGDFTVDCTVQIVTFKCSKIFV